MNILYDFEGCEYSVDDYGQVYVLFEFEHTGASVKNEEEKEETIKIEKVAHQCGRYQCHM